ncbi:putative gamma DNA-directed DNA polymerase [Naematelia encephala]|uniref:Mitochondrial DNA polymerase catalytic subunit n=1 Tax=Naematelia encephala TaxID=71784 RepID=A0A1Y2BB84_9TREE|nr:putative gamma DNA-directed DNA polymerase [Naematelia encephala]
MQRLVDVARLTRPARLRCRPQLIVRSQTTRSQGHAAPAQIYKRAVPRTTPFLSPRKQVEAFRPEVPADEVRLKYTQVERPVKNPRPSRGLRRNPVGVQLLSPSLHKQLFPGEPLPKPPKALLDISRSHLQDHVLPEINFEMPRIRGGNIREHFHALGRELSEPYITLAHKFATAELPPMPESWVMDRPGWTRYGPDGSVSEVEDLSEETMVSFDIEVCYKLSKYPVLATAVTPNAWYSWLCPTVFESPPDHTSPPRERWETSIPSQHPHDLIPLFSTPKERIVIGHNVGYDRARVKEEYNLERSGTRWLDTLALHVATRGITSVQRPAWIKYRQRKKEEKISLLNDAARFLEDLQETAAEEGTEEIVASLGELDLANDDASASMSKTWEDVTSMNSLAEVAALHCGHRVDKSIRNRFGDDDITHVSVIRDELHPLIKYCAGDVKVTHDVFGKVFPLFLESCPHPATFAGVLTMGNSFLPVNESWAEYLKNAEMTYRHMDAAMRQALQILAEKLRKEGPKEDDPFHSQLNWTPKKARWPEDRLDDALALESLGTSQSSATSIESPNEVQEDPEWFITLSADPTSLLSGAGERSLLPLVLRLSFNGHPAIYITGERWCFMVPHDQVVDYVETHGEPIQPSGKNVVLDSILETHALFRIPPKGANGMLKLNGSRMTKLLKDGSITSPYPHLVDRLKEASPQFSADELKTCLEDLRTLSADDPWRKQLDASGAQGTTRSRSTTPKPDYGTWPKWYHDLTRPATNDKVTFGELDLTHKKTVAPLLLRLQWQGYPLFHSKKNKWLYRMKREDYRAEQSSGSSVPRGQEVELDPREDLFADDLRRYVYFRLPHKDGEGKNVGNPLAKAFAQSIESGELASAAAAAGDVVAADAAETAIKMTVLCSYWISSRERIMDQMVVYDSPTSGMILPQVITMGTVTRRAVESTWLTAANAKKNRVGSELKAMIRAPPGYSIVGADVDSEELWISSVMGDSQFGTHGATAIGWMTLEGTKSAGTDLHSKTANILGTSRDAAKVFNYSRIYGAGQKHAVQLLMQGDPSLSKETAAAKAKSLYQATKGNKTTRDKRLPPAVIPSLWHGGSESFLFNTLEAIALSDRPATPALGCGVTKALSKSFLEGDSSYLPSRINWVVQSSGVDYLHLLIVSMEYLIKKYNIDARYLISVHDEVRYLAKEEDRYRTALALQIANAWTRALFCFNLGIDDVPQGVAFFSAVDVDHVLRKEVFMTCETPSHTMPIPAGESLDIHQVLEKTGGGVLGPENEDDASHTSLAADDVPTPPVLLFNNIRTAAHERFLHAQARTKGGGAKWWLNSLPPVVNQAGTPLPIRHTGSESKASKATPLVGRKYDPLGTFSDEELSEAFEAISSINPEMFRNRARVDVGQE